MAARWPSRSTEPSGENVKHKVLYQKRKEDVPPFLKPACGQQKNVDVRKAYRQMVYQQVMDQSGDSQREAEADRDVVGGGLAGRGGMAPATVSALK